MRVSLRQAFKNVASEKYDKKNMFLLSIVFFISGILGLFLPAEFQNQELMNKMAPTEIFALLTGVDFLVVMFIGIVLLFLTVGCYVVATNNAIMGKQGVFPHPFEEAGNLLAKGFLYSLGSFVVVFAITIIAIIIAFALASVNPWFTLLIVPIVVLMVHAWLCVNFGYYVTLEFKEWFCFRKNWIMIGKILRRFASYVAKALILFVLSTVILCSFLPLMVGLQVFVSAAAQEPQTGIAFSTVLFSIINAALGIFVSAYTVDLTAQLLSPVVMPNKENIEEL